MMIKPSGNIDVDFLKGMIPHHQGAIDMSEELIKKSKDTEDLIIISLCILSIAFWKGMGPGFLWVSWCIADSGNEVVNNIIEILNKIFFIN